MGPEFTRAALRVLYNDETAVADIDSWYDAALQRLPYPYSCTYVDTHLGRTHVLRTGNPAGPPVVLLHGLMNNALIWKPQLAALQAFDIYAVDIVGQPGRSYRCRPSLLTDAYAHWLIDIMDHFGLHHAAFVGLSMGALLLLKLAAYDPGRVSRMALLSPAGIATLRLSMYRRIVEANLPWRDFHDALRDLMAYIYITPGVDFDGDTAHMREFLELTAQYQKPLLDPRAAFEGILTGLPLSARELARCKMPALVLIGADDVMFDPVRVVRNAAQNLPNFAGSRIIPNAGHAMIYQQVEQVNAALTAFLDGS